MVLVWWLSLVCIAAGNTVLSGLLGAFVWLSIGLLAGLSVSILPARFNWFSHYFMTSMQ